MYVAQILKLSIYLLLKNYFTEVFTIVQVVKVTSLGQDGVAGVEPHASKPTLNCAQLSQKRQAKVNEPVFASSAQVSQPAPKLPFVPWKESNPAVTNQ